jgi:glycosyltransferase involved in cell wall biosynthesis
MFERTEFHILSFEGPDPYSTVGGLETRVEGLCHTLAERGVPVHLWFVGDPSRPGHELRDGVHLHRWCQWISRHCPGGVYEKDTDKARDYAASLPPWLIANELGAHLWKGGRAVVMAEEWQTAHAVAHLDWLLRRHGLRGRVDMLWNANNTYGFGNIDWPRLEEASRLTTVSRYMRAQMPLAADVAVIPNGLERDAYIPADPEAVAELQRRVHERPLLAKIARWDPDKCWMESLAAAAELKRAGLRPLLLARGGTEPYGREILGEASRLGLRVVERINGRGARGLLAAVSEADHADVISLRTHVDAEARRTLLNGADTVLANSAHEPFGLVGLETMAVGGVACTGHSGEEYARPGRNALVTTSGSPTELAALVREVRDDPERSRAIRRAGRRTARRYAWSRILDECLAPHLSAAAAA